MEQDTDRTDTRIAVDFLPAAQWEHICARGERHALALIAFSEVVCSGFEGPFLRLQVPANTAEPLVEAWWSSAPVSYGSRSGIRFARSGEILFGAMELAETSEDGIDELTRRGYLQLLDFLAGEGDWNLLRIWNYFPAINSWSGGLERYGRFCLGRHEAFAARGWDIARRAPAACALGSRSGPLQVYFIASKRGGRQIENPRQMPAYRYPAEYAPRSPSFARATLARLGGEDHLFISGTASIVGHRTLHAGDVKGQCMEILANLRALAAHSAWHDGPELDAIEHALYKVYLRNMADHDIVRPLLARDLHPQAKVLCLGADVCRGDLLLEIEGIWTSPASQ
jgi:chorismate lyase/3-hydroxybenzoate synthase